MCTVTRFLITARLPACLPGVMMCNVMCLRQVLLQTGLEDLNYYCK